jgi:hypothetical protein
MFGYKLDEGRESALPDLNCEIIAIKRLTTVLHLCVKINNFSLKEMCIKASFCKSPSRTGTPVCVEAQKIHEKIRTKFTKNHWVGGTVLTFNKCYKAPRILMYLFSPPHESSKPGTHLFFHFFSRCLSRCLSSSTLGLFNPGIYSSSSSSRQSSKQHKSRNSVRGLIVEKRL